ncbi:alanine/ornithine racemase family PLP-dependent enzyme [Halarsenatibacter silvermanii]|uniref:Predicted amino acid racemase n=1 Tax=Halarsenatibacter silvermanii TaxID=321763 RepID=A0A1G9I6L3_9FIRM|nr:alanine/ornithine racemase family PLP-dependent enzyme [Halarsenatibacter silvermanii]SDL20742.1 Predicted amino acid racemase [Halarsenatibacter silvermanii]
MTAYPNIEIDLRGIRKNIRLMKKRCRERGVELTGVVKGAAGNIEVAGAFIEEGISSLGDSRLNNIKKFREAELEAEYMLLRLPDPEEAEEVVRQVDISLNSELKTLKALSLAAQKLGRRHRIIVMIDTGDLREGLWESEIDEFFSRALEMEGLDFEGIGTNVGCYGGVLPDGENTGKLVEIRDKLREKFDVELPVISGGNTATTILLEKDALPQEINNLRIGEGILQGTDATHQRELPGFKVGNFKAAARIIELKNKPSLPRGNLGRDSFGQKPEFKDRGLRRRAILALGRQDVRVDGLKPLEENLEIMGASSDHLLIDVTEAGRNYQVGDVMKFDLSYGAMLAGMTSEYMKKVLLD